MPYVRVSDLKRGIRRVEPGLLEVRGLIHWSSRSLHDGSLNCISVLEKSVW